METNKIGLERRIGSRIPLEHPLLSWLTEYSAWMCCTMRKGDDGLTPFHRARGRPFTKRLITFGETVLAQEPTKGPQAQARGKLEPRWVEGVVLGYGSSTHAYWVHTAEGVDLYRSAKRVPSAEQWDRGLLEGVSATRKSLHQPREPRAIDFEPAEAAGEARPDEVKRRAAKQFEIRQGDLDPTMGGIGWTDGCPACVRSLRLSLIHI